MLDISIIVPTYNRLKTVTRTLKSLFAQDYPPDQYEIIVVDDGSADGTSSALRSLKPACAFRVIEQENRGPAAARNTGYRTARAHLVLFLDDDMLCDPGLIAAHAATHRDQDRTIAFGSLFLSPDSPPGIAAECFNSEIGAFHLQRKGNTALAWRITDCVFSNTSLPRALLEEVGGFDESFRMREDFELGIRLLGAGAHPRYAGDAIAYQYYGKTASDLIGDAEIFAEGDMRVAQKHPGTGAALVEGRFHRLALEPAWKQWIRRAVAAAPVFADLLLAPVCLLGDRFFNNRSCRNLGVRALQARRSIHWYHRARKLGWKPQNIIHAQGNQS
jgi:GT2 family glycosyltransferase